MKEQFRIKVDISGKINNALDILHLRMPALSSVHSSIRQHCAFSTNNLASSGHWKKLFLPNNAKLIRQETRFKKNYISTQIKVKTNLKVEKFKKNFKTFEIKCMRQKVLNLDFESKKHSKEE